MHVAEVLPDHAALGDAALVELARGRDEEAVRVLVRRHNRRLFRVARGVLRDDAEAEDVVQATYVRAFTRLDGFRGEASLVTWLTRIALNEALGRLRRRRPKARVEALDETFWNVTRAIHCRFLPRPRERRATRVADSTPGSGGGGPGSTGPGCGSVGSAERTVTAWSMQCCL